MQLRLRDPQRSLACKAQPTGSDSDCKYRSCMHAGLLHGTCSYKVERYFQPKACGNLKCSKEALELYRSEGGRSVNAVRQTSVVLDLLLHV